MTRVLAALAAVLVAACARANDPLPALGADPAVTVSGISSGGFMAVQFHVAHSSTVKGAGVIAGGPFYCAQGSVWAALSNCTNPTAWTPVPPVELLKADAEVLARGGLVDPVANLATTRVWLFAGILDRVVEPPVVEATRRFYALFKPPPENVVLVADKRAGHGMITADAGIACELTAAPYINDCDFDAAGELLKHLLGPLELPAPNATGRILRFDQKPFADGDAFAIGMGDSGYLYVPQACDAGGCRVHVALHGCRMSVEQIGERFVREAGYNRWADANRLVVLYPQTTPRNGAGFRGWRWSFVFNPRGCWDWWGYTGPQYANKAGPQIRALKAMIDRLAAPRGR
ncbi:MAG TPA: depolymerase [Burkholderiales bacterium]|nr:depolymerase [Burkholderiales bacterium]